MRKSTKLLLGLGVAIATPVIINHVIAKKAEARIKELAPLPESYAPNVYNWEYGDISYTKMGEGKPLLLLHGIYPGASGFEWEDLVEILAEDYTVYVPDLLGFGYSSKPAIDYSSYLLVRLIKDFAENVIGEPVTAIASLHTAAALASCAALNPEDFEKIVLISPTGLEAETPLAQDEDGIVKKALESPIFGTSVYNALCSKKGLAAFYENEGHYFDEEELDRVYLAAHAGGANGKYAMAALLGKFFNTDIKQTLTELNVPYSIVTGENKSDDDGFNLYGDIADTYEVKTIELTGLMPHTEAPQQFYDTFKTL